MLKLKLAILYFSTFLIFIFTIIGITQYFLIASNDLGSIDDISKFSDIVAGLIGTLIASLVATLFLLNYKISRDYFKATEDILREQSNDFKQSLESNKNWSLANLLTQEFKQRYKDWYESATKRYVPMEFQDQSGTVVTEPFNLIALSHAINLLITRKYRLFKRGNELVNSLSNHELGLILSFVNEAHNIVAIGEEITQLTDSSLLTKLELTHIRRVSMGLYWLFDIKNNDNLHEKIMVETDEEKLIKLATTSNLYNAINRLNNKNECD